MVRSLQPWRAIAAILPLACSGNYHGDDNSGIDAATDTTISDGAQLDAGDARDSWTDAGCGSTTTVDNCGACNVACNKTTGTPACDGVVCSYTCNTGHLDCDQTPPNTNGCECIEGAACSFKHTDGTNNGGNYFYDCEDSGISLAGALKACSYKVGGCVTNTQCEEAGAVCSFNSGALCGCWVYEGLKAGRVHMADAGQSNCLCPLITDSSWY